MNVPNAFLNFVFVVYVHFALQRGSRSTPIAILAAPTCFVAHCSRATRERPRDDRDAGNFATPRAKHNIKVIGELFCSSLLF